MITRDVAVESFLKNVKLLKDSDIRKVFKSKSVDALRDSVCKEATSAVHTTVWRYLEDRKELEIEAEKISKDSLVEMVFFVYCLGANDVAIFSNIEKVAALLEDNEYTKHIAAKMREGYDISALTLNELLGM